MLQRRQKRVGRVEERARFGELRALLQGRPSRSRWAALWRQLEAWHDAHPEEFAQVALPYVVRHLERWPDRARRLPTHELEHILSAGTTRRPWAAQVARTVHHTESATRAEARRVVFHLSIASAMEQMRCLELPHGYMRNIPVWMLAKSPHLHRLRRLDLSFNGLGIWAMRALAKATSLEHVVDLAIAGNGLSKEALEVLLASERWRDLVALDLHTNRLHAGGARALGATYAGRRLRRLNLGDNALDDRGVRALRDSRLLDQLTHLDLSKNDIGPLGASMLIGANKLGRLDLSDTRIGDDGGFSIIEAGMLAHLRDLDLSGVHLGLGTLSAWSSYTGACILERLGLARVPLGQVGCDALGTSPHLTSVTDLDLEGAKIDARAIGALLGSSLLRGARRVRLSFNPLTSRGASDLIAHPCMEHVRELALDHTGLDETCTIEECAMRRCVSLELRCNALGDEVVRRLAQSPWVSSLKRLGLRRCNLTDAGAEALAASPYLSDLEELDLGENAITREGTLKLIGEGVPNLHRLDLDQCILDDAAAREIARHPEAARLRSLDVSWSRGMSPHGAIALDTSDTLRHCEVHAQVAPLH